MEVLGEIGALRRACDAARSAGGTVGLVPTMGYLHAGHRSLMRRARQETDLVVVTIFVNPLQFGANEDLDRYPRDLEGDRAACAAEGVDVVFAPTEAEMYPRVPATTVHVEGLTAPLCGAARPGHFDGVTTVVAKLFAMTGPCRAYFGRKDAQQLAVVARMAADLDLPVEVVGCPLVREPDGLARSSRNAYLTPTERAAAPALFRALSAVADGAEAGARDLTPLLERAREIIAAEPRLELEYLEARDAGDLTPVTRVERAVLVAVAARLGATRLIDNVSLAPSGETIVADRGVVEPKAGPSGPGPEAPRRRVVG